MPAFKVVVRPYSDPRRPHLKFYCGWRNNTGKRCRSFFEKRQDADTFKASKEIEVRNFGIRVLDMPESLRIEAMACHEELHKHGKTLTDATRFMLANLRAANQTLTVKALYEEFVQFKESRRRRPRYIKTLKSALDRFCRPFGKQNISFVKADQVENWIDDQRVGDRTWNHLRTMVHTLFGYAKKRHYLLVNPISEIEPKAVADGRVGILTPEQLLALLTVAQGDLRAIIAIGAFAGLRPEREAGDLTWEAIDLEEGLIDVGQESAKTAEYRYVKVEPVLKTWIEPLKKEGRIRQKNFWPRFKQARRDAGFRCQGRNPLGPDGRPVERELIPWPHDALRHSYASYHLAMWEDAPRISAQMGHTTTKSVFKSYRHRVKKAVAEKWWSLFPNGYVSEQMREAA